MKRSEGRSGRGVIGSKEIQNDIVPRCGYGFAKNGAMNLYLSCVI
jgi:hypothetical protein